MALTTIRYYDDIIPETSGTIDIGNSTSYIGTVTAQDFNSVSDLNLKSDIKGIENALDTINKINGYTFNWKDSDKNGIGVIAQEIEAVIPDLISTAENGIKSVAYISLIPILIEAVKELSNKIDDMK